MLSFGLLQNKNFFRGASTKDKHSIETGQKKFNLLGIELCLCFETLLSSFIQVLIIIDDSLSHDDELRELLAGIQVLCVSPIVYPGPRARACTDQTWNKSATKDLEVSVFVGEVFDGVRDDAEAHAREVGRSDFKDSMGERLPLLVDLFHRHRAHDGALVALQSLLGN